MSLRDDGITAVPTYEQLRSYLTSMPYAERASFETVSRALIILRLTRWLTLAQKRRAKDGSHLSNLYILHDEPLTPFEAMRLDDDYLALICHAITHASKAVQRVAAGVLDDIADDPFLAGKKLPTRLEILLGRVHNQTGQPEKLSTDHKSEEGKTNPLRNQKTHTSESEASLKTAKNQSIRNLNKVVSSSNINILLQSVTEELTVPKRFYEISEGRKKGLLLTLKHLSPQIRQQILNEWDGRCRNQIIRNPVAYLYGMVQKAIKGQFNDLAEPEQQLQILQYTSDPPKETKPKTPEYEPSPSEKEQIQQHIQKLRNIVSKHKSKE